MRGGQGLQDFTRYRFRILKGVVVPKSQDSISLGFEKMGSLSIVFNDFGMLTTVNFDDQFLFDTTKIDNKGPDGVLPSEFITKKSS